MTAIVPYMVACPSTKRPENMHRMLEIFPDLQVFVSRHEVDSYVKVVPRGQLNTHDKHGSICAIQNDIIVRCQEEFGYRAFLLIDDDLNRIRSNVWQRPRWYTDPQVIREVVENGINILVDLDLPMFTWIGRENPQWLSNCDLFKANALVMRAWLMYATDRDGGKFPYRTDEGTKTLNDYSISLEILLNSRVVLMDKRWFFDFGSSEKDIGGLQSLRTSEVRRNDENYMRQKWGKHFDNISKFPGLDVNRKSPAGYKG